jgi:hypothetical protein
MQRAGLASLTEQLRSDPSSAVCGLGDEHLTHLATAIRAVRRRQAEQLQSASDQALTHIPRLLRGPVKKIVGG